MSKTPHPLEGLVYGLLLGIAAVLFGLLIVILVTIATGK